MMLVSDESKAIKYVIDRIQERSAYLDTHIFMDEQSTLCMVPISACHKEPINAEKRFS